jgi:hypothetical protein
MYVSIKRLKIPKLKHTHKNSSLGRLTGELLAHKRISLPGRGKEKGKIIL